MMPRTRLAESILARAVKQWGAKVGLLPAQGISEDVVDEWADKMGSGARIICSAFKKIWTESPSTAKGKELTELKQKLNQAMAEGDMGTPTTCTPAPSTVTSPSTDFLEVFDWGQLEEQLVQLEEEQKQTKSDANPGQCPMPLVQEAEPTSKPSPSTSAKLGQSETMELPAWA